MANVNVRAEFDAEMKKAAGKTVLSFSENDDAGANRELVITFTDGTRLVIEYDWIYDITMSETGV